MKRTILGIAACAAVAVSLGLSRARAGGNDDGVETTTPERVEEKTVKKTPAKRTSVEVVFYLP